MPSEEGIFNMRLDKLLSNSTAFTRSQAKIVIKKGKVKVDGGVVTNVAQHIKEDANVEYMGVSITKPQLRYLMYNKPAGIVCANKDNDHQTIFDTLFVANSDKLHVAGRLDIDTTGLVLLTDDGQWLHRITSPKHQHYKIYLVDLHDEITEKQISILETGVQLKDEKNRCQPAIVEKLDTKLIRISISEGKYHQVKRMMAAVGNHLVKLHREQIADIKVDENLEEGKWRELTEAEFCRF
jgi:16S rRNA pseudouridine516 synthase